MSSVSALGTHSKEVWDQYKNGNALFKPFSGENPTRVCRLPLATEKLLSQLREENANYSRLDRSVLLAIASARSTLSQVDINKKALGVNLGSSRGATNLFEGHYDNFLNSGAAKTLASPTTTLGNLSAWVAQDVQAAGAVLSHSVTCATALHAVLNGIAWLEAGMASSFLVGGTEAPLTPFTLSQMQALKIYSKNKDDYPCRALDFDKPSNTMILGEAAATAILKKGYHKNAQGHIVGYGWGTEALEHHTSLSQDAVCFQESMQQALEVAKLESVDAIVMHAPGTRLGDQAELNAIQKIFSNKTPFLTTNKAIIGHTLGASGMMSLEMALLMLANNSLIHPYYFNNLKKDIDSLETVMVNAVGFGGNAVSIIVTN